MKKLLACLTACILTISSYAQYSCQHYDLNTTNWSWPYGFSEVNGQTYFVAESDTSGPGLWRFSNGIAENLSGTLQPAPSSISRRTRQMPYINGKVYFVQINHNNGTYRLSAYTEATKTVSTVPLSAPGFKQIWDAGLLQMGNRLYFTGVRVDNAGEIFSYDPASGNLEQITHFKDMAGPSGMDMLTEYNGLIAFQYINDAVGRELGILDVNTRKVYTYDIVAGKFPSTPEHFTAYNGKLYFSAETSQREQLYSYTPATGPVRLTDTIQIPFAPYGFSNLYGYKDAIIFATSSMSGSNLYQYNIGPRTVTHLGPHAVHGASVYGGKLFMSIDSKSSGGELYVYDGFHPMQHISQLLSTPDFHQCSDLAVANNKLFFAGSLVAPFIDIELNVLFDSSVVGINNMAVINEAVVYPNPATSLVQIGISLNENAVLHVVLTDMQGRIVYSAEEKYTSGKQQIVVPVKELATGVYAYTIANEQGVMLARGKLEKQ